MTPHFRAWHKELKFMATVLGFDGHIHELGEKKTEYRIDSVEIAKCIDREKKSAYYKNSPGIAHPGICAVCFDEVVLMQSTGLTDKNGTEIYEGDVVDTRYGRRLVEWDDLKSGFLPFHGDINCPDAESESEVVGDVYRNPDLLK